ncbi:MAG: hypothetical protein N2169_01695 [bacterium]|nr:hypothetical protein [bacterium]
MKEINNYKISNPKIISKKIFTKYDNKKSNIKYLPKDNFIKNINQTSACNQNYVSQTNPININNLFKVFLKSLNKNYPVPLDLHKYLPQTFDLINKLGLINYNIDYYSSIYTPLSNYFIKDFNYLLETGIILFIISNSKGNPTIARDLKNIMKNNDDKLIDDLSFFIDNDTYLNKKVFGFLSNSFILNSPFYIKDVPPNILDMFVKSKQILNVINSKNYIDSYLWDQINGFLNDLFSSLKLKNDYLRKITKEISFREVEIWKNFFVLISQVLSVLNNIKSYPISNKHDLDRFMEVIYYMNLTLKDNSYIFYLKDKMVSNEHKNILNESIDNYQSHGVSYNEAVKNSVTDLFSSYISYVSSFIRKNLRNKDFTYGDFYHFFKIYIYSSLLIELIKNSKDNTQIFNFYKNNLSSLVLTKYFANNFYQILNNPDKQKVLSALEVLKSISQRATISAFPFDPNLPKNRTLYLRLNLWIKTLKNLPKDNNYKDNVNIMISYLNKILKSYQNTDELSNILNNINFENVVQWINLLDPLFNSLAGSNISKKYGNLDYLFSQLVINTYFKNRTANNYSDYEFRDKIIKNIYENDPELNSLVDDLIFYNTLKVNNRDPVFNGFIDTLHNYYNSCLTLV